MAIIEQDGMLRRIKAIPDDAVDDLIERRHICAYSALPAMAPGIKLIERARRHDS